MLFPLPTPPRAGRFIRCIRFVRFIVTAGLALVSGFVRPALGADDPFAANVRLSDPLEPAEQRKTLKVPPGFEVQLVASEPDIHKPMNLGFDAVGRLWVTTSREYPYPAPQDRPGRDRVMIFSDFAPDGRATKVTEFAAGLNIPIGVYPFRTPNPEGRLTWKAIVWSIPNLWLFEDTDDDGRADRREPLYGPFDFSRDTHGNQASFRRGFDGWLYATHGFNNDSRVAGRDGHRVHLNSGNTYRVRLDGNRIEHHTWGQVNPFGLAWDPQGNLFSSDCHSEPIYLLLPGAYYPSFGKPHDGLGFAPSMMEKIRGSTAIDGISFYADDLWPPEYADSIFVGDVMTSRVYRDLAVIRGSARLARPQPDFVVSEDPWFRPVDTTIGPDGALYIADFYNRIIGHYEVPLDHPGRDRERGRIWRVIPTAKPLRSPTLPDDLPGLIAELASPSLPRRLLAMNAIADSYGLTAEPVLRAVLEELRWKASPSTDLPDAHQLVHTVWLLERLGRLDDAWFTYAATRPNSLPRIHAQRILAERGLRLAALPNPGAQEEAVLNALRQHAVPGLRDPDLMVRRCAAQALATRPALEHVAPLLAALAAADPAHTHLIHSLRQALRNQLADSAVAATILGGTPAPSDLPRLADVAVAVKSESAGSFLLRHVATLDADRSFKSRMLQHAARYAPIGQLDALVRPFAPNPAPEVETGVEFFRAIQQGLAQRGLPLTDIIRQWGANLARELLSSVRGPGISTASTNALGPAEIAARQTAAAEIAASVEAADLQPAFAALAANRDADLAARAAAARALPRTPLLRAAADLVADTSFPLSWRVRTANVLFDAERPGAEELIADVWRLAPYRFQLRFAGLAASTPELAAELVERMETGKAPAILLQDRALREQLERHTVANVRDRVGRLVASLPAEEPSLRRLLEQRRSGFAEANTDPLRGQEVFRAACAACHQIGSEGGLVGPQLTGIGTRGLERLCEDILAPNRNVDRAFWTTVLNLRDGETASGLFRREEGELIVLANAAGTEFTVPKADVTSREESSHTLMPTNFDEAISAQQFYDLLAFLLSQTGQP